MKFDEINERIRSHMIKIIVPVTSKYGFGVQASANQSEEQNLT